MNYKETIELEKNIKIKDQADRLYSDFMRYGILQLNKFSEGKFILWQDTHNKSFIIIENNKIKYCCEFINNSYEIIISPAYIFEAIKREDRGLAHLKSRIKTFKKEYNETSYD